MTIGNKFKAKDDEFGDLWDGIYRPPGLVWLEHFFKLIANKCFVCIDCDDLALLMLLRDMTE